MSSVIQLKELIPVMTPLGNGYAIILETSQHDQYWTVALDNSAIVTFRQDQIMMCKSYTHNRCINDSQMKDVIKKATDNLII